MNFIDFFRRGELQVKNDRGSRIWRAQKKGTAVNDHFGNWGRETPFPPKQSHAGPLIGIRLTRQEMLLAVPQ